MNTKQNLKEELQALSLLAKTSKKDAYISSFEAYGDVDYAYITGYLLSRLENIARHTEKLIDKMKEE